MTPPIRGVRNRRGGRRPGWLLLTALLVLAILASATLVFTTRVELLRLAVILSLWAAVLAAFVSVIYRRQSDVDQARARDMKHIYDLQLDREITARREYELNVEAQLRRQLSLEVRAGAADELAALRAEVAALRSNLEIMLGTDLGTRPALEAETVAMAMPSPPGRVQSSRVVEAVAAKVTVAEAVLVENPIIDVPEEPLTPPTPPPPPAPRSRRLRDDRAPQMRTDGGIHRTPVDQPASSAAPAPRLAPPTTPPPTTPPPPAPSMPPAPPGPPWRPPETGRGRHRTTEAVAPVPEPDALQGRHRGENPVPEPAGRHRTGSEAASEGAQPSEAEEPQGQHADGQSFTDLMAKLRAQGPVGGGGRRRRED